MVERYLHGTRMLLSVFLLVDIRHAPSENDLLMYDWIRARGFLPRVIATKADKLNKSEYARQVALLQEAYARADGGVLLPFSALTRQGRDDIYAQLQKEMT